MFSLLSLLLLPVALAGLIVFFIGMNGLANAYRNRAIFNSILYAVLTVIVGAVLIFAAIFAIVFLGSVDLLRGIAFPVTADVYLELLHSLSVPLTVVFVGSAVVPIVSMWFMMRSFGILAAKSGVAQFRTAALLFLTSGVLGAASLVVVGGLFVSGSLPARFVSVISLTPTVVQLVAWAVATQGFSILKADTYSPQTATNPIPSPTTTKICSYCGAQNLPDALYCKNCGRQLTST